MMRNQSWAVSAAIALAFLAILPALAAEPSSTLSHSEEQLAVQIGFEKDILALVKEVARSPLHRLNGYDENEFQIMANGVVATVARNRSEQVLWELRERLKPRKYMAFLIEVNLALKADRIGIIKGTDQFEILRIMYTNGDDDDVTHEDVVNRLRSWSKRCPFEIIGAENDWVEIEFRIMPRDVKAFAEEVYAFSPDAVDDGPGSIAGLVREINSTRRVTLSWE
jgi:hypothetical protein